MKKNRKKILIITMLIMVSILTILFVSKELINKNKLPEKSINNITKNKSFAIMITNENGIGYKEYDGDVWPEGYSLTKSECVDNNGNQVEEVISYDESTNKVTLKTKRTVYCTLYFDKSIIGKLRENDPNKVLSKELVGGIYRYQGVGVASAVDETHKMVDNNYICFGTNDTSKCNCNTEDNCDKYMYRIIGVTKEGQLYLIKMKGVKEGDTNTFMWNDKGNIISGSSNYCVDGKCPEWAESMLYKRLNGENSNGNPIFVNNTRYEYMQEDNDWYNKIESHNWMYGDIDAGIESTELNGETLYGAHSNGLVLYDIETGVIPTRQGEFTDSWQYKKYQWSKDKNTLAKIGLMYMHDYALAYDNIEISFNSDKYVNSWLFIGNNNNIINARAEWLINQTGIMTDRVYRAFAPKLEDGVMDWWGYDYQFAVRPVFYLNKDIKITNGNGTLDNPYMIASKNEEGNYYYNFEYVEDYQTFNVPEDGTYKIELWGASGGASLMNKNVGTIRGKGAYTSGEIYLTKGLNLFIYVGGAGEDGVLNQNAKGGYNGGGLGTWDGSDDETSGGGGGATDIRLEEGSWDSFNSLKSRIMVAAGGGGASFTYSPGPGGGISSDDVFDSKLYATQTSGYKFGQGMDGNGTGDSDGVGGGGSGYYGGKTQNVRMQSAGAGGSSFISGHNGCNAINANSTSSSITHTGNSQHYSNYVFKNTLMIDGNGYNWTNIKEDLTQMPNYKGGKMIGNVGNGYARITKIS